jgi:Leucine-rich repeat (LRR) protein
MRPHQVRALKLSGKSYCEVPNSLIKLCNIEYLNLDKNFITFSDKDISIISCLKNLKCLILSNNSISTIDKDSIGEMSKSVEILVLRDNKIKNIPIEFAKMKQIQFVDLSNNMLEIYPEALLRMENIRSIWVAFNPIKEVNCNFSHNRMLESISFTRCEILNFSANFPRSIISVSLNGNKINRINFNWENCPDLELLNLTENPKFLLPDKLKLLEDKKILIR